MRSARVRRGLAGLAVAGVLVGTALAQQEGVVEKAGQKIDDVGRGIRRGVIEIGEGFRNRFEMMRNDVHRMGVQPRVYSRLHWDRALHDARIEVHMLRDGSVLLRGTVPDAAARRRAVELARDTKDVMGVVDELVTLVPEEPSRPVSEPVKPATPR